MKNTANFSNVSSNNTPKQGSPDSMTVTIKHPVSIQPSAKELEAAKERERQLDKELLQSFLLENIIDEPLIDISNLYVIPECIKDIDKSVKDVVCQISTKDVGELNHHTAHIISGGALSKIIHAQIHQSQCDLDEILKETDVDVFLYRHNGVVPSVVECFEKDFDLNHAESYEIFEYNNALNISGILKGKHRVHNQDVEIIFASPQRIQSFDINNRNIFYQDGKLFSTTSALDDLKNNLTLITSVHTPVSSLIRALTYEVKDHMKISPVSIKLLKWVIKHFGVNIADEKIKKTINNRKLTDKQKELVYNRFREVIPIKDTYFEDVEISEKKILRHQFKLRFSETDILTIKPADNNGKNSDVEEAPLYKLNENEISELEALTLLEQFKSKADFPLLRPRYYQPTSFGLEFCFSEAQKDTSATPIYFSNLFNNHFNGTERLSKVSEDAKGYEYPFNQETLDMALKGIRNKGDEEVYSSGTYLNPASDIASLNWTKSFYDAIVNYVPLDFNINEVISYDITHSLSLEKIYNAIYSPYYDFLKLKEFDIFLDFKEDRLITGLNNSNFFTARGDNFAYFFKKELLAGDFVDIYFEYFERKIPFDELKSRLLNKDLLSFIFVTYLNFNKINNSRLASDGTLKDFSEIDQIALFTSFLLKHTSFNHLHIEQRGCDLFNKENIMKTDVQFVITRGINDKEYDLRQLVNTYTSDNTVILVGKKKEKVDQSKLISYRAYYSRLLRNMKYTLNSHEFNFNTSASRAFTQKIGLHLFADESIDDAIHLESEAYLILFYLIKKYPNLFDEAENGDFVKSHPHIVDYNFKTHYFDKYKGNLLKEIDSKHRESLKEFLCRALGI